MDFGLSRDNGTAENEEEVGLTFRDVLVPGNLVKYAAFAEILRIYRFKFQFKKKIKKCI